ncbi:hypothetical protein TNCV_691971 [Trichonephila clavipes]|nr:hypothetical protein TNCV_691971 [Trichonephila clavipes]
MGLEESGPLNNEIGRKVIGVKCCLRTSPNSVKSVTLDLFLVWRERSTQNNPIFIPERSYIADEMVCAGISTRWAY